MDIFNKIINEAVITTLSKARKNVDKNPTDGQKEAGNYRKGHVNVLGFQITIENPKGSYRKGKDKDGHEWKTLMHNDYGYFVRTLGKDGDAIDVFIGPNLKSQKIFPIDQFVNGEFDETKVMLGFDNKEEAKAAYLSNYEKDWKGFKYITEVDIDTFKKWLYDGYRQRKPFAKYMSLTESKKQRKNDEGKVVPEKCECGGDVVLQIHGEPVYICKKCGKYFGTMPFSKKLNESMINESFNSPLLAKYAKEHGGLKVNRNGGLRQGVSAYHGGSKIDPSQVTDDMLYGEPFKFNWQNNPYYEKQFNNSIFFADGYAIMLKPFDLRNGDNIDVPEPRKKANRYGSGIGDTGDHDKSRGGFVGNGKDAVSAPYNGFSVSDRAGEGQMRREAWNNNLRDIKYWKEKIEELKNEIENESDFYRRNMLQKEIYHIKQKIANAQENVGEIKKYSRNLRGVAESKKYNQPKYVAAAIRKANRDADIESHGKATDFRTTMTKNPKVYSRKEKHKKQISENVLRQIIRESIEEFYKGSRKEKAAYENARDCLYYGYGFKSWFERNSELLDGDVEFAKKIWQQAKEDLANDF